MNAIEYVLNPVRMTGKIKSIQDEIVTLHLKGRLGVLTLNSQHIKSELPLVDEMELEFYFSYIQVVDRACPYDASAINQAYEMAPTILSGQIVHVDDTSVKVLITGGLGTIIVPRRWVFTSQILVEGLDVEFYFSYMQATKEKVI